MLRIRTAVSGAALQDVARRHRAVHAGHGEIHDHHLRLEFGGELHGLVAVFGFADHGNRRVVLQHAAEAAPHQAVVVHQQDGNRRFSHGSPE
jgi:hypothetical protein